MSRPEICIGVNHFHRFRSRPWGPDIPLRKLFLRRADSSVSDSSLAGSAAWKNKFGGDLIKGKTIGPESARRSFTDNHCSRDQGRAAEPA